MPSVRVIARVRAKLPEEGTEVRISNKNAGDKSILTIEDVRKGFNVGKVSFGLESILGEETHQEEVYKKFGEPAVDMAFQGYHSTFIAYGQTGSGKTYTIFGPPPTADSEAHGLLSRLGQSVFKHLSLLTANPGFEQSSVEVCFYEIYLNNVYDLLVPSNAGKPKPLDVVMMNEYYEAAGLTWLPVSSTDELLSAVETARKRRAIGETMVHASSSRSHAVVSFRVAVRQQQPSKGPVYGVTIPQRKGSKQAEVKSKANHGQGLEKDHTVFNVTEGYITTVDLSGSERLKVTKTSGIRLQEGISINQNLSALSTVLTRLANKSSARKGAKEPDPPWRSCPLTKLLKRTLSGESVTTLIAHITAASYSETSSTLTMAAAVRRIKFDTATAPQVKIEILPDSLRQSSFPTPELDGHSKVDGRGPQCDVHTQDAESGVSRRCEQILLRTCRNFPPLALLACIEEGLKVGTNEQQGDRLSVFARVSSYVQQMSSLEAEYVGVRARVAAHQAAVAHEAHAASAPHGSYGLSAPSGPSGDRCWDGANLSPNTNRPLIGGKASAVLGADCDDSGATGFCLEKERGLGSPSEREGNTGIGDISLSLYQTPHTISVRSAHPGALHLKEGRQAVSRLRTTLRALQVLREKASEEAAALHDMLSPEEDPLFSLVDALRKAIIKPSHPAALDQAAEEDVSAAVEAFQTLSHALLFDDKQDHEADHIAFSEADNTVSPSIAKALWTSPSSMNVDIGHSARVSGLRGAMESKGDSRGYHGGRRRDDHLKTPKEMKDIASHEVATPSAPHVNASKSTQEHSPSSRRHVESTCANHGVDRFDWVARVSQELTKAACEIGRKHLGSTGDVCADAISTTNDVTSVARATRVLATVAERVRQLEAQVSSPASHPGLTSPLVKSIPRPEHAACPMCTTVLDDARKGLHACQDALDQWVFKTKALGLEAAALRTLSTPSLSYTSSPQQLFGRARSFQLLHRHSYSQSQRDRCDEEDPSDIGAKSASGLLRMQNLVHAFITEADLVIANWVPKSASSETGSKYSPRHHTIQSWKTNEHLEGNDFEPESTDHHLTSPTPSTAFGRSAQTPDPRTLEGGRPLHIVFDGSSPRLAAEVANLTSNGEGGKGGIGHDSNAEGGRRHLHEDGARGPADAGVVSLEELWEERARKGLGELLQKLKTLSTVQQPTRPHHSLSASPYHTRELRSRCHFCGRKTNVEDRPLHTELRATIPKDSLLVSRGIQAGPTGKTKLSQLENQACARSVTRLEPHEGIQRFRLNGSQPRMVFEVDVDDAPSERKPYSDVTPPNGILSSKPRAPPFLSNGDPLSARAQGNGNAVSVWSANAWRTSDPVISQTASANCKAAQPAHRRSRVPQMMKRRLVKMFSSTKKERLISS
eukprot:Rmarinus@m.13541